MLFSLIIIVWLIIQKTVSCKSLKLGKTFGGMGLNSSFFLSFFLLWQKPQCNQVVLGFSCLPNKKTEQEVFVFGKKFFHFYFILFLLFLFFSLTALIFRRTWNQTFSFFFKVLQQVYLSTTLHCFENRGRPKLFIYFYC